MHDPLPPADSITGYERPKRYSAMFLHLLSMSRACLVLVGSKQQDSWFSNTVFVQILYKN